MYSGKLKVMILIWFILYQCSNTFRFNKLVQDRNRYYINRYQSSSINEIVGSTVKSLEEKKIEVSKKIEDNINEIISIPSKVQSNVQSLTNEVKETVENVSNTAIATKDAIVNFPADVVNRVETTRNKVSKSITDIQLKVVATKDTIVKIPSDITMTIEATKANTINNYEKAINTIETTKANTISSYEKVTRTVNQIKEKIQLLITLSKELYETKDISSVINKLKTSSSSSSSNSSNKIKDKSKNSKVISPAEVKSFDIIESFDNTKEFVYTSIDNTVSLYRSLNKFAINTIETVQKLPQSIKESQRKLLTTKDEIQSQSVRLSQDITSMSSSTVKNAKYFWRLISLQIAKEQYDRMKPALDEFQSNPVSLSSIQTLFQRLNKTQQQEKSVESISPSTTSITVTTSDDSKVEAINNNQKKKKNDSNAVSIVMDAIGTTKDVIGTVSTAVKDLNAETKRLQRQYEDNLKAQGLRGEQKPPQIITVKVYNNNNNNKTSSVSTSRVGIDAREVKEVEYEVNYVRDIVMLEDNNNNLDSNEDNNADSTIEFLSSTSGTTTSTAGSEINTITDEENIASENIINTTVEIDKVVEVKNVKPSTNTIADVFATFPIVISDNNNDIVPFEIEKNYVAEVVVENDEVTLNNPTSDNSDTSNYDSSSND